jgi:uncharacterized protein (TIGR00369 family)
MCTLRLRRQHASITVHSQPARVGSGARRAVRDRSVPPRSRCGRDHDDDRAVVPGPRRCVLLRLVRSPARPARRGGDLSRCAGRALALDDRDRDDLRRCRAGVRGSRRRRVAADQDADRRCSGPGRHPPPRRHPRRAGDRPDSLHAPPPTPPPTPPPNPNQHIELRANPVAANPAGNLHGGVTLSMAMAAGVAAARDGGEPLDVNSVQIAFLRPCPSVGIIRFVPTVVHRGRNLAVIHVDCRRADGRVTSVSTITCGRSS